VGGVRLEEPAADLAIALALASSLRELPMPSHLAAFGEVGLSGEIRAVTMPGQRVAEAAKFGFARCLLPKSNAAGLEADGGEALPVVNIEAAISMALER
jgi:DNA repair protein RadA/Sms